MADGALKNMIYTAFGPRRIFHILPLLRDPLLQPLDRVDLSCHRRDELLTRQLPDS